MYKITVPTIVTNGHFNKEKTLAELKRCGADRVALAIDRELDYTFSSPQNLKLLAELVPYFRENGFEVLVWLGETLGHDGNCFLERYTKMRAIDDNGKAREIGSFCPADERFTADFCRWVKDVAACRPDMIMLDDDFRLSNRRNILLTCCCDKHLKRISELAGVDITADNIQNFPFTGRQNVYRDAWLTAQKETMEGFAAALRAALDEVDPGIRLGFCACTGSYGQEGWDAYRVSRIMAGGTKPFLRTIGAPYWCSGGGNRLGEIMELQRSQLGKMTDGEVFAEGDTYPRPRTACPAAWLECYDMIIRADGRADGILKYMLDYVSDADYETGYVDAMVKNAQLYAQIKALFDGGRCTGVKPYLAEKVQDKLGFAEMQATFSPPALYAAYRNSLPTTYEDGFVNLLFGENARYIREEELKNGSVIDITAAKILIERGIDVGIAAFLEPIEYAQKGFADQPQEYFIEEDVYVRLSSGIRPVQVTLKDGARLLSEYVFGQTSRRTGDFVYENAQGMRFRVMTIDAESAKRSQDWLSTYAKRRSLVAGIAWLGRALDAAPDGNYPELYLMTKEKGDELSVGAWNLFSDKIENMRLRITGKIKSIRFVNCRGHREGNVVVLDDVLYPYEFAGFEIIRESCC